ncbi:hypothetical protein OKW45_007147 [Paraburkholderia sp. WSM4175]|uniref:hypothetical protein n=1 Tax=Paraburkholderia sp. WSM4175 TaxID=2991072 RepID=UPI003D22FBE2
MSMHRSTIDVADQARLGPLPAEPDGWLFAISRIVPEAALSYVRNAADIGPDRVKTVRRLGADDRGSVLSPTKIFDRELEDQT